jgi:hypothetical protein
MANRDNIAGHLSTQNLSDYLATLGLFLMLFISGMLTFLGVRLIEAYFPGTPQAAYWVLGFGIVVVAYFAYGQIKSAPLLAPVVFVVVFLLCREVASKPLTPAHPHVRAVHQTR